MTAPIDPHIVGRAHRRNSPACRLNTERFAAMANVLPWPIQHLAFGNNPISDTLVVMHSSVQKLDSTLLLNSPGPRCSSASTDIYGVPDNAEPESPPLIALLHYYP